MFSSLRHIAFLLTLLVFSECLCAQHIQWKQPKNPLVGEWRSMSIQDDFVYVLTNTSLMRTHLNGGGWRLLSASLPSSEFQSFFIKNNLIVVSDDKGWIYLSTNLGAQWTAKKVVDGTYVSALVVSPTDLLLICNNGNIMLSDSLCTTWASTRMPPDMKESLRVMLVRLERSQSSIQTFSSDQYSYRCVLDSTLYRYTRTDSTWRALPQNLDGVQYPTGLYANSDTLVLSHEGGMIRSTDAGQHWLEMSSVYTDSTHRVQLFVWNDLLCTVSGLCTEANPGAVFRSNDRGSSWYRVSAFRGNALEARAYRNEVVVRDDDMHVIDVKPIINDALDLCAIPTKGAVSILAAHPQSGFVVCDAEPLKRIRGMDVWLPVTLPRAIIRDAVFLDDRLIACGTGNQIAYSDDAGLSWFDASANGLPSDAEWKRLWAQDHTLYALSERDGVFCSFDGGSVWSNISAGAAVTAMFVKENMYVSYQHNPQQQCIISFDAARTVSAHPTSFSTGIKALCITQSDKLLAIDENDGWYQSNDSARSWLRIVDSQLPKDVAILERTSNLLIAASSKFGLFMSSDDGAHWTSENFGLKDSLVTRVDFADKIIYLATNTHGLFYGTYGDVLNSIAYRDNTEQQNWSVSPVPASDFIMTRFHTSPTSVDLFDMRAQMIRHFENSANGQYPVSDVESGFYMLVVRCQQGDKCIPLIIYH